MSDMPADLSEEFRRMYDRDRERLALLVDTHSCTRLNGTSAEEAITGLWSKMTGTSTDALAILLAVAVDELTEKSWGAGK